MPSDYEAITKQNIKELGERTSSRKSQVNLYSQPTHFIYELLQNADDYGATEVQFELMPDKLILEHNGKPFSEKNVRAISDFENSTSKDDETKTGRFGLGFKSVFAFTATPQIVSGDECFEIYGLYRLRGMTPPENMERSLTRIVLPFNHAEESPDFVEQEKSAEEAYAEISAKLKDIGLTTLLFTKNVTEVQWFFGDASGHYLKDARDNGMVDLTDGDSEATYLVFSKSVEWEGKTLNPVSIAFRMKQDRIVESSNRSLFVLFETALETHLGFLVNGAFRTTPSRENIRYEDDLNKHLIKMLASLVAESLGEVKRQKLLNAEFLQCLPIKLDKKNLWKADWEPDYPGNWPFMPIYDAVLDALLDGQNEYLPAAGLGNRCVAAKEALLARGEELRSIFTDSVLRVIWNTPRVWLSGDITADKTPGLRNYLRHALGVKEIEPSDILKQLSERFFSSQPTSWLVQFYFYVQEESTRRGALKSNDIPCVPTQEGKWDCGSNVVFGASSKNEILTILPSVKEEAGVQWPEIKSLLEYLGVHEYDTEDDVSAVLKEYYAKEIPRPLRLKEHLEHMRLFISFWQEDESKATRLLKGVPVFVVDKYPGIDLEEGELQGSDRMDEFFCGEQCYIDQPLKNTFLTEIFFNDEGISKQLLSHCYKSIGGDFFQFVEQLDVQSKIMPVKSDVLENPLIDKGTGAENYRCPREDWKLPHEISQLFDDENAERFSASALIWEMMSSMDLQYFKARYQRNSHREIQEKDSLLIQQLSELPWLVHKNATEGWKRPCDLTEETLYTGVSEDHSEPIFDVHKVINGWLKLVGFGQSEEKQNAVKILGFPPGIDGIPKEDLAEFVEGFRRKKQATLFPENKPRNPERRSEKTKNNYEEAPEKTSKEKTRTVRISVPSIDPKPYLRQLYTNDEEQLVCQMCQEEMPFKLRDGNDYFEAVQLFDDADKEMHQTYLALCPECAAKYKLLVKVNSSCVQTFKTALLTIDDASMFAVDMQDPNLEPLSIRFAETHLLDVRTVLGVEQKYQVEVGV
ncbi:MAG: ATP-binding protein [Verrucomicrobiota bacterium]